jgi:hypothetical protein
MLCAHLVEQLREDKSATMLYYFCGSPVNTQTDCSRVLRSLAIQLVRYEPALAAHVCANYIHQGVPASVAQLRKLLPDMLSAVARPRILVDGLDECNADSLPQILTELLALSNTSTRLARVLISSREGGILSRKLRQKPFLALREESTSLYRDIEMFITGKLSQTRSVWDFEVKESTVIKMERELLRLSNGPYVYIIRGVTSDSWYQECSYGWNS